MIAGARLRLEHAERLLDGPMLAGVWPRCAVWLIRLALEHSLDALWLARSPEVRRCSKRSQLLALGVVLDQATQYRVVQLWSALSRAGHHHHYDLAPTVAELRGWLAETSDIVTRLDVAARSGGGHG
ncbi:hypothetical protein [Pseudonocardia sp.]|uniref:hypothetical protein n=1 Tax=Pseudonocardia sp. TaxID=60912 RepID=UPI00260822AC|nr:hypothetical protein [Pseudonocardia sp.]